jgi:hypothetical protein
MYKIWSYSIRRYLSQIYNTYDEAQLALQNLIFVNQFKIVEAKDWYSFENEYKNLSLKQVSKKLSK